MEDPTTPLLSGIATSETMNGEVSGDAKEKASTENVVDIVGAKPSFVFIILMFGLMSFNTVRFFLTLPQVQYLNNALLLSTLLHNK